MATATELRSLVQTLSDEAGSDLSLLWAQIFTPDLRAERDSLPDVGGSYEVWIRPLLTDLQDALMDVMPALVGEYSDAAAVVSADWYDEYRDGQGVGGSFRADVPVSQNLGAEALAGWGTSLITPETADWDAALTRLNGGLQRRIS
ncbi:VG15 protein, partial [Mycolicibacterium fortuitum]|uniref:VG15 protein n=1 Tax=Mycolicibacterium fortuitum TaxID=1766 RepID=UPI001A95BE72